MKNLLIVLTALAFQSCCIGARDSGPVLLDASDRALNPYHVGDSFKMRDSKTGNEYWFKVKSRAMSAAQLHSGHKECGTQLHTQKEETLIVADTADIMPFEMNFTKGDLNVVSQFIINGHFFQLEPNSKIDSMVVLGRTFYEVLKGTERLFDRSNPPLIKTFWTLFYTPQDGIIQGVYSDSSTVDLIK